MRFILAGIMGIIGNTVFAKEIPTLVTITGPEKSAYSEMSKDLGKVCKSTARLKELQMTRTLSGIGIRLLIPHAFNMSSKQRDIADLAFIPSNDLLIYQKNKKPGKGKREVLKILLPLNREEVLLIVKEKKFDSFEKIKKIGSISRSLPVAKGFKKYLNKDLELSLYENKDFALKHLRSGKIDSFIILENKNADWIKDLKGYTIISIPYRGKIRDFYKKSTVKIPNLNKNSISTLSVRNLIVTRNFIDGKRRKSLLDYRKCILKNLNRLQSSSNFHPEWKDVDTNDFNSSEFY